MFFVYFNKATSEWSNDMSTQTAKLPYNDIIPSIPHN